MTYDEDDWDAIDALPEAQPANLTEADFQGCRWIDGEPAPIRAGMFCCEPVAEPDSSWCALHYAQVFRRWVSPRQAARQADAAP